MCNESYCTTLQKERHNNRLCNVAAVFIFAGEVKNVFSYFQTVAYFCKSLQNELFSFIVQLPSSHFHDSRVAACLVGYSSRDAKQAIF